MSIRRKLTWVSVAALALIVILALSFRQEKYVELEPGIPTPVAFAPLATNRIIEPPRLAPDAPQAAVVNQRTAEQVRKMSDYFNSLDGSIRFFGRVLDQDRQPVAGAKIKTTISRSKGDFLLWVANPANTERDYNPVEQETAVVTTDSSGGFAISDKRGFRLDIESVSKEGWLELVPGGTFYGLARSTYRYGKERDPDVSSIQPGGPVVFVLWKKGMAQSLISHSVKLQLPPDSTTRFNFVLGQITTADEYDLEFRLTGNTSVVNGTKRFGDWKLSLETKSGGLLMADQAPSFEAPETGYAPTLQFVATDPSDLRWSQQGETRRLFFRGRNGRVAAVLSMQFDVHPWDGGRLRIDALVNLHGSRTLEPDPEKQITDPEEIRRLDEATRP